MVKICFESPEVSMHGEINFHAQAVIVNTAKLDAISVNGTCNCSDGPAPDSYNNKGWYKSP